MPTISFCKLDPAVPGPFAQYLISVPGDTLYGAILDGKACGAAAANWSDGALSSLFVDPQARGNGIAGRLLDLLLGEGVKRGAKQLRASYVLRGEELTAMDALFRRRGGEPVFTAPVWCAWSADCHGKPVLGRAMSPRYQTPPDVLPFSRVDRDVLAALNKRKDIPAGMFPVQDGRRPDPALSMARVIDGQVAAYLLCLPEGLNCYHVLAAWSAPGAPADSFLRLLAALVHQCYYRSGDFGCIFKPVTERGRELAERILEGAYDAYEEHTAAIPVHR